MNRSILRAMLIAFASLQTMPAAALRHGLGFAVAKQGGKIVERAANRLPSCGGRMELFNTLPITDPNLASITPLGHILPPGHTFPADHMYFNYNGPHPNLNTSLYAPADGWVVMVSNTHYSSGAPYPGINSDYVIMFSPCREVNLSFMHVVNISAELANPEGITNTRCQSFGTGGESGSTCSTYMQVPVKAGQKIGSGIVGDFGPLIDTRMELAGYANPSRHDLHRGFCPLNYFTPSVKAQYMSLVGANSGATFVARTIEPICGTIVQDLAGTAQGDWYIPGAGPYPEDPNMALVHDNVNPVMPQFSVGTSVPGMYGSYVNYNPKLSAGAPTADGSRINYDFSLVNDNQLYCFDNFVYYFAATGTSPPAAELSGRIVLMQLTNAAKNALKIEVQNPGSDCTTVGASSWAFTSAAVNFVR